MRVLYQSLPHSCLLTLHDGEGNGHPLAEALQRAIGQGEPSVWVDCRYISALPGEALLLLSQCAASLWKQGGHLVMCHLPALVRAALAPSPTQPLAASLLDADLYGLPCPDENIC